MELRILRAERIAKPYSIDSLETGYDFPPDVMSCNPGMNSKSRRLFDISGMPSDKAVAAIHPSAACNLRPCCSDWAFRVPQQMHVSRVGGSSANFAATQNRIGTEHEAEGLT